MILNRIAPTIEQHLIKEHAGFKPGKSCTSQLLNLIQHIKDGYQESMITETAFVYLSVTYDTSQLEATWSQEITSCQVWNHPTFLQKSYNVISGREDQGTSVDYARLTFFWGKVGHADLLDGWRCSS